MACHPLCRQLGWAVTGRGCNQAPGCKDTRTPGQEAPRWHFTGTSLSHGSPSSAHFSPEDIGSWRRGNEPSITAPAGVDLTPGYPSSCIATVLITSLPLGNTIDPPRVKEDSPPLSCYLVCLPPPRSPGTYTLSTYPPTQNAGSLLGVVSDCKKGETQKHFPGPAFLESPERHGPRQHPNPTGQTMGMCENATPAKEVLVPQLTSSRGEGTLGKVPLRRGSWITPHLQLSSDWGSPCGPGPALCSSVLSGLLWVL